MIIGDFILHIFMAIMYKNKASSEPVMLPNVERPTGRDSSTTTGENKIMFFSPVLSDAGTRLGSFNQA